MLLTELSMLQATRQRKQRPPLKSFQAKAANYCRAIAQMKRPRRIAWPFSYLDWP
jgi:hypothetical protein